MARRLTRRTFLWYSGLACGAAMLGRDVVLAAAPCSLQSVPLSSEGTLGRATTIIFAADLASGTVQSLEVSDGALRISPNAEYGSCVSPPIRAPIAFTALAPYWQQWPADGDVSLAIRVSSDGDSWSEWQTVAPEDPAASDATVFGAVLGLFGPPLPSLSQCWVSLRRTAKGISPTLPQISIAFLDTSAGPTTAQALALTDPAPGSLEAAVAKPGIISRSAWGCPEGQSSPRWPAQYQSVTHLFIHHTATANFQADWAAVVRAIWSYHTFDRNWGDIGYNCLVDPNGNLFEGRAGGDDVVAGHTYGFNSGTLGLAFLGTFNSYYPPGPMQSAGEALLAWKASQRSIDPIASRPYAAYQGCPTKTFIIPTILGHRDAPGHSTYDSCNSYGATECPGNALEGLIPSIRSGVVSRLSGNPGLPGVSFAPVLLVAGNTLRVDFSVVNASASTLNTQGPPPGFAYREGETYRSLGYPEVSGAFRVGVDFTGRTGDADHPFRWGLGSPLAPGASTSITGYIRLDNASAKDFWAGLVQEDVRWHLDNVASTRITVVAAPQVSLNPVSTSKTWFVLTWQGAGGIGELTYRLEKSLDGANWLPWLNAIAATKALFVGVASRQYYLRAVATDREGNVSATSQIAVFTGTDSSGLSARGMSSVGRAY